MTESASKLQSIAKTTLPCKICGSASPLFGVVDFARSCEEVTNPPGPLSGIPIYYQRCEACGFIFTAAFDEFTQDDFSYWIYNDRYLEADHEYLEIRPAHNGKVLAKMFENLKELSFLDYGGGNGKLAETMRSLGFANVDVYDPYVHQYSQRPTRKYPVVFAFEVIEHAVQPAEVFADLVSFIEPDGLVIFSTTIQGEDILRQRVNWWYVAPRNGHVSLHSWQSLNLLAQLHNLTLRVNEATRWFILHGQIPAFAQRMRFPQKPKEQQPGR